MVDRLVVAEMFLAQLARTEDFIADAIQLNWLAFEGPVLLEQRPHKPQLRRRPTSVLLQPLFH
jgi:hypothetical protein